MLDYRAVRNVGDIVKVPGPYFNSLARVTAFHADAEPTQIDFVVVDAKNRPWVSNGDTGRTTAGHCPVVTPDYVPRHAA